MIRAGRVTVDGEIAGLGTRADPARSHVEVDGIPLPLRPDLVYRLLNKPSDVISTATDPQGRRTVVDLVPADPRVFPVGRLDADSEGLLLLTNDGELANLITHPRHGVSKTYLVRARGRVTRAQLRALVDGVELEDGPARARAARLVDEAGGESLVEVVMGEGRNREVRRMFDAIDRPVLRLVRTAIGPLRDADLKPGEWRDLGIAEVRSLYDAARPA